MKNEKGFTLIELLVVIALMSILTLTSVSVFFSYTRSQVYQTTVADFVATLNLAKNRSLNRVKPSECGTYTLRGYQVSLSGQRYRLRVDCGPGTIILTTKNFPSGISFAPGTIFVNFAVGTGVVAPAPLNIVINGHNQTKTVTVDGVGNISVQ